MILLPHLIIHVICNNVLYKAHTWHLESLVALELLLADILDLGWLDGRASAEDALGLGWDEAGEVDVVCLKPDWCEDEGR